MYYVNRAEYAKIMSQVRDKLKKDGTLSAVLKNAQITSAELDALCTTNFTKYPSPMFNYVLQLYSFLESDLFEGAYTTDIGMSFAISFCENIDDWVELKSPNGRRCCSLGSIEAEFLGEPFHMVDFESFRRFDNYNEAQTEMHEMNPFLSFWGGVNYPDADKNNKDEWLKFYAKNPLTDRYKSRVISAIGGDLRFEELRGQSRTVYVDRGWNVVYKVGNSQQTGEISRWCAQKNPFFAPIESVFEIDGYTQPVVVMPYLPGEATPEISDKIEDNVKYINSKYPIPFCVGAHNLVFANGFSLTAWGRANWKSIRGINYIIDYGEGVTNLPFMRVTYSDAHLHDVLHIDWRSSTLVVERNKILLDTLQK